MKEYKVLSQRDKRFHGKFDAIALEGALNDLAREGWVVKTAAMSAEIPGFFNTRPDECIVILEKEL